MVGEPPLRRPRPAHGATQLDVPVPGELGSPYPFEDRGGAGSVDELWLIDPGSPLVGGSLSDSGQVMA